MSEAVVARFAQRFAGRTDVWGALHGQCVREEVTAEHWQAHLAGTRSLGVYPLLDDGTCRWACVDFDVASEAHPNGLPKERAAELAGALREALSEREMASWFEISKSGGYHLWLFFSEPVLAQPVRSLLSECWAALRAPEPCPEIFPKQDRLAPGQVGNYVHLPYFGGARVALAAPLPVPLLVRVMTDGGRVLCLEEFLQRADDDVASAAALAAAVGPKSEVRSPRSEVRSPRSEVRSPRSALTCFRRFLSEGVDEGARDQCAFRAACHLRKKGAGEQEALAALIEWNATGNRFRPPLSEETLRAKVHGVFHARGGAGYQSLGCDDPLWQRFCSPEQRAECLVHQRSGIGVPPMASDHSTTRETRVPLYDHWVKLATPEAGFIGQYLDYVEPFSESPVQFHLAGALACLSVAAGANVLMRWGDEPLHTNLFLCLVGPQAVPRKSTALRTARRLAEEALAGPDGADSISIAESGSDEAIFDELAAKPQGVIWWSELSAALAQAQKRYSGGLKQLLAECFDAAGQTRYHKTRSEERSVKIVNPAPRILAATTLNWLNEQLNHFDLLGGFLSRFVFIFGDRKSKFLPVRPPHDPSKRAGLISQLQQVPAEAYRRMGEAFRLGPEAHEAYCAFYREFEDRPLRVRNPYLGSFASRLTTYALKLAILYELAYFPDSREVSLDAWEHARAFTEVAYQGALRLLEETEVGGDRDYNRVLTILREAGEQGLRQRDLMRRAGLPKPKFDAIREALVEGGAVRWWNEMTAGRQAVMLAYAAPDE